MCATSAVSDYYQNIWPNRNPQNPNPFQQIQGPMSGLEGVADALAAKEREELRRDMAKVLSLLDKIDKRLGDVECMDEAKAAFLAQFKKPKRKKRAART